MTFIDRICGGGTLPGKPQIKDVTFAATGGFIVISLLAYLTQFSQIAFLIGSLGASCVLVFGVYESPFAQPRNIIGGHLLSAFMGLLFYTSFGDVWWSMGLAVASAIAVMMLTQTLHPPAGSNPLIIMITKQGWDFLLTPTFLAAVSLVILGVIINAYVYKRTYPKYWY